MPPQAQSQSMTPAQKQQQIVAQNMAARRAVISQAVDMWQTIYTNTITTGPGSVINIPLRNVGLVKRFLVRVRATVTQPATPGTVTLTKYGIGNFFSSVILTDLSNQQRINTAGWHLAMVQAAKRRRAYGAAMILDTSSVASTANPFGFGNNFNGSGAPGTGVLTLPVNPPGVQFATAVIGNTATWQGEVDLMLEIPLAYSDHDLRGAVYANINNATFNLQLTVNPNMFVASGADPTLAMYQSSSATLPTLTTFDIEVIQNYLDQLPRDQNNVVVLPMMDLSTAYLLNNTSVSGVVNTQDNPIPYANFREFMSTTVIYDNAGNLNLGTDLNYFALQSANFTNIWKISPKMAALWARLILGDDPPAGMYYFDHRHKPINTRQYGNMELIANPSTVSGASAAFLVGWEALAIINLVTGAGSLFGT
jgi:P3 major capsid protein